MNRMRRSGEEESKDIPEMKMDSKSRTNSAFDIVLAGKKPLATNLKMSARMEDDEGNSHVSRTTAGTRKTRSSSDIVEVDPQAVSRPSKVQKLEPSGFYGSRNELEMRNSPATRSSTRNLHNEIPPRQRPKTRTPSPERWTKSNPGWKEKWRNSIIYPQEGKHKATVDKQDIERLDEGEFLNDNLIMFYLLWLERILKQERPDLAQRVYFHNTFFYERLSKPVKGKRGINYEAVERWTSKVDLLAYDYIIVPVNEHSHWYVAIICNAPKLLQPEPEVIEVSQPQDTNAEVRRVPSDTGAPHKPPSPSSPKPPASPSGTVVGESMKHLSVRDTPVGGDGKVSPGGDVHPNEGNRKLPENETSPTIRRIPNSPVESKASTSTVREAANPTSPSSKKGKRKSLISAPRKYDPKDPRIITLDSLDMAHSATCTNLRDYLIAEAKSKRGVDLTAPRPLGMKSTKIPIQKNYCDCGLFLLSYVEEFLTNPDQFTNDILQRVDMEVEYEFKKASEMRNHIRELLFELQRQQQIEEDLQPRKGKAKKPSSPIVKDALPTPVDAGSRETSKSARPSAEPVGPSSKASSTQRDLSETETGDKGLDLPSEHDYAAPKPSSASPVKLATGELNGICQASEQAKEDVASKAPSQEPIDLEDEMPHPPDVQSHATDRPNSFISNAAAAILKPFRGFRKEPEVATDVTQPGSSHANPAEIIDDSPRRVVNNAHTVRPPKVSATKGLPAPDLRSPSPDEGSQYQSFRHRQSTPYPEPEHISNFTDLDEEQKKLSQMPARLASPVFSSPPLERAGKPPSSKPSSNVIDMTLEDSQIDDDREMLLPQDPVSATTLLNDSSPPTTPATSPGRQLAATSPQRGSNRKPTPQRSSHSSQSPSARRQPSISMDGRDSLDKAVIGRFGLPGWKGKRTQFSPEAGRVPGQPT